MAWNVRWQLPFKAFDGTQYVINIYEQNYSGSVTQLTGADKPFTTQEDDNDDIFQPIRTQTGYIRVIDTNGTLMEQMIPSNNTQRMVRLMEGGTIKWQGFMQAQAYTQPWEDDAVEIEFPVKSVLGVLEDISIPSSKASSSNRLAALLTNMIAALSMTDYIGGVVIVDDAIAASNWLMARFLWSPFYNEELVNNQGDATQVLVGQSYSYILTAVCNLFGLTARESGDTLIFAHYDQPSGVLCRVLTYTWANITSMASSGTPSPSVASLPSVDMMSQLTFEGDDNNTGYVQGARSATIVLNIADGVRLHLNLPQTTEDTSTTYDVTLGSSQNTYARVQPHPARPSSTAHEQWTYKTYYWVSENVPSAPGNGSHAALLQKCVLLDRSFNPQYASQSNLAQTGAFPCRWYKSTSATPTMNNGLFLVQMYLINATQKSNFKAHLIYQMTTPLSYKYNSGYIRISFKSRAFNQWADGLGTYWYFDDFSIAGTKMTQQLNIILKWGNKEWDGTQWVTYSSSVGHKPFVVQFLGSDMTGYTTPSDVDGGSGMYIPITEEMDGNVMFGISNAVICEWNGGSDLTLNSYCRILTDLEIEYVPKQEIIASTRRQNTYRKEILASGFTEEKATALSIGTYNNNIESPVFLQNENDEYIEGFTYNTGENSTVTQRPELRLLDRMAAYLNQVRRTHDAVVHHGLNIFSQLYVYLSRVYMAVDATHNWRDNRQTLKFIEVTGQGETAASGNNSQNSLDIEFGEDTELPTTPEE